MKKKFNLPDRAYCDGDKEMVSMRLPKKLWGELEKLAEIKQWTTTDVVATALDEYLQWEKSKSKRS